MFILLRHLRSVRRILGVIITARHVMRSTRNAGRAD
jgi:hypothetical protein